MAKTLNGFGTFKEMGVPSFQSSATWQNTIRSTKFGN
jgi:hypothetical protein